MKTVGLWCAWCQIAGGGDEGGYERVFYFATDPGVADRSVSQGLVDGNRSGRSHV